MKEKFLHILKQLQENPVDFTIEDNLPVFDSILPEIKEKLIPFGSNKAGCLICYWHDETTNDRPIVWLDSEGEPNAVFAFSESNFFQLLPYGTGMIYDIIQASVRHNEKPEIYQAPGELFSDAFKQAFDAGTDDSNMKNECRKLIEKEMNLIVPQNPGEEIYSTYKKFYSISVQINKNMKA